MKEKTFDLYQDFLKISGESKDIESIIELLYNDGDKPEIESFPKEQYASILIEDYHGSPQYKIFEKLDYNYPKYRISSDFPNCEILFYRGYLSGGYYGFYYSEAGQDKGELGDFYGEYKLIGSNEPPTWLQMYLYGKVDSNSVEIIMKNGQVINFYKDDNDQLNTLSSLKDNYLNIGLLADVYSDYIVKKKRRNEINQFYKRIESTDLVEKIIVKTSRESRNFSKKELSEMNYKSLVAYIKTSYIQEKKEEYNFVYNTLFIEESKYIFAPEAPVDKNFSIKSKNLIKLSLVK